MTFGFHSHLPAIVMITHRDIWRIETESNHSYSLLHEFNASDISHPHSTAYLLHLMEASTITLCSNKAYVLLTREFKTPKSTNDGVCCFSDVCKSPLCAVFYQNTYMVLK